MPRLSTGNVIAAIVSFNPDISRLRENIEAICKQVEQLYVYDNASTNVEDIRILVRSFKNAELIENGSNVGIARSLNRAAQICIDRGFGYLLTLDQDSICPQGMVQRLLDCFVDESVGLACPSYYDSNRGSYNPRHRFDVDTCYVEMAITSASLCRIDAYRIVGGFDNNLFVGGIDNDYCHALICAGFKIVQVNTLLLDHELGVVHDSEHSSVFSFLHNVTGLSPFKKLTYRREISSFRVYHGMRAQTYLLRKHRGDVYSLGDVVHSAVSNLARSNSKKDTVKAIVAGVREGLTIEQQKPSEIVRVDEPLDKSEERRVLIGLLEEFDAFCARENLTYYLIGGALIGAVRDGDLLAWDDDIDVAMKREDFETLCASYTNSFQYELLAHSRNPIVREGAAKLADRRTVFDEGEGGQGTGVFLDIFPLDYFSGLPSESITGAVNHVLVKQYIYATQKRRDANLPKLILEIVAKIGVAITGGTEAYLKRLNRRLQRTPSGATHLVNWWGFWGLKEVASIGAFSGTEAGSLGECVCKIPVGYDEWLTNVYGDYMTPPREPGHFHGRGYWKQSALTGGTQA